MWGGAAVGAGQHQAGVKKWLPGPPAPSLRAGHLVVATSKEPKCREGPPWQVSTVRTET